MNQKTSKRSHIFKLGIKKISVATCGKGRGSAICRLDHKGIFLKKRIFTWLSWDVGKVHTDVARNTCPSQNVQSTTASDPPLEVEMLQEWTPLWREAHVEVKSVKNWRSRIAFWRSTVLFRGRRYGFCTLPKVRKTSGFSKQNVMDRWMNGWDGSDR